MTTHSHFLARLLRLNAFPYRNLTGVSFFCNAYRPGPPSYVNTGRERNRGREWLVSDLDVLHVVGSVAETGVSADSPPSPLRAGADAALFAFTTC